MGRDDRTLGEIHDDFNEQRNYIVRNANRYVFPMNEIGAKQAKSFRAALLKQTMERCGINATPDMDDKFLEKRMDQEGMEVHPFDHFKGQDAWKNGWYVMKHGELMAFIGATIHNKPSPFAIDRRENLAVVTNVTPEAGATRVLGWKGTKNGIIANL